MGTIYSSIHLSPLFRFGGYCIIIIYISIETENGKKMASVSWNINFWVALVIPVCQIDDAFCIVKSVSCWIFSENCNILYFSYLFCFCLYHNRSVCFVLETCLLADFYQDTSKNLNKILFCEIILCDTDFIS